MKFSLNVLLSAFLVAGSTWAACPNDRMSRKTTPRFTHVNDTQQLQQDQQDDDWGEFVPGIAEHAVRQRQSNWLGKALCVCCHNEIFQPVKNDILQLLSMSENRIIDFPRRLISIFITEPRLLVVSAWLNINVGGAAPINNFFLNPFKCTLRIFPYNEYGQMDLSSTNHYKVVSFISDEGRPVQHLHATLNGMLYTCGYARGYLTKDEFLALFDVSIEAESKLANFNSAQVSFPLDWFIINLTD